MNKGESGRNKLGEVSRSLGPVVLSHMLESPGELLKFLKPGLHLITPK